jgi:hypothetical protein
MLKRHFPLFILIGLILGVIIVNFSPHTFLLGWDNLPVELNLGLNMQRSIFSAWQSFQGLGLLAGNGHAADLIHQLIFLPLSFLPLNLLRQAYIFLMLALGPIGAYFLIKKLLSYKNKVINNLIPVLGGLFYLLNLATIQTFYVAFEPFVTHFAALPWLLLSALYFIAENNKKALIFFIIVNLLSIPQGQVPTVFFVYLFSLSFFLLVLLIETRRKFIFKKCVQIIILTLIINAFWLLPFGYFFLTNSQVAFNAKINQMATETVFLQNKEFGNIQDVMLLKGFWLNNVDLNSHGQFAYMLSPWKQHLTPIISSIGYLLFLIIILGFTSIKRKMPFAIPFSSLFLLSFTMLTTNTPPFSWINEIFRKIPLFNEVFRFPFTKFSTLASLTYAFFFSVGVGKLMIVSKNPKFKEKIMPSIIFVLFLVLLITFISPVFRGNLFYYRIKVIIPKEYFQLFDYLKTKDRALRIANFPQPTFWGWSYYRWGYDGSGFLWYGIEQPILDRAFDVWSKNNENYYWEISNALYSKNAELFKNVLNKYNVSLLLLDENIIYPSSPQSLFNNGLKELISEISSIQKDKTFGNLTLYKVDLKNKTSELRNTVKINPYNWTNDDKAYAQYGNYISQSKDVDYFYPFRSLFSGKNEENQEFNTSVYSDKIELSNPLPIKESANLLVSDAVKFVSADLTVANNLDNSMVITATIQTPEIFVESQGDRRKIWGKTFNQNLFTLHNPNFPIALNINGLINFKINKNQKGIIGKILLLKDQNTVLSLKDGKSKSLGMQTVSTKSILSLVSSLPQKIPVGKIDSNTKIIVTIPRIENDSQGIKLLPSKGWGKEVKNCESFKEGQISGKMITENGKPALELTSENSTACISYSFPTLDHNQGYIALIENANKEGRSIHFWFLNEDRKNSVIDTYLKKDKNISMSAFIIPPGERFSAGYSLHLDNQSIGKGKVVNSIGEISVIPIPYELLSSLRISDTKPLSSTTSPILVNYQSFDQGWKAYEVKSINWLNTTFPFLLGKELKEHVLVNSWANGWILSSDKRQATSNKLIIIFWPQYLEYLGLGILLITFVWLILSSKIK